MNWQSLQEWFFSLGENYGVNPLIFGAIYVGAIPLFSICIGWLIRNYRKGESILLPAFLAMCCFVSAYVYLIIAGKNVPYWVYGFLSAMIAFGAWSTIKKIRRGVKDVEVSATGSKKVKSK
jgi:hypothetical protein